MQWRPSKRGRGSSLMTVGGVLAALGCSDPDPGGGCPLPRACDVRAAACQALIFRATACERDQQGATLPPVRTLTLDAFAAELAGSGSVDGAAEWTSALQLLGLVPESTSLGEAVSGTAVENVAAFYDPSTKGVTIIDRGDPVDPTEDVFELSHEFTHALQDQAVSLVDFRDRWVTSTDSLVATKALTEGEAMVIALAVTARAVGNVPERVRWTAAADGVEGSVLDSVDADPAPLIAAVQSLPYPVGLRYVAPRWLAGGRGAVDELYGAPLTALVDFLQDVELGAPSLAEPLACYPTTAPAGFTGFDQDALGAAGALGMAVSRGMPARDGFVVAQALRGDSLAVFTSDAGEVAVAYRTRWATAADADRFGAIAAGSAGDVTVEEREVTILAVGAGGDATAWKAAMGCGTREALPMRGPDTAPSALHRALRWPRRSTPHRGVRTSL